jgi:Ser/Thr protein kinase RdoA (MazF antagonist)
VDSTDGRFVLRVGNPYRIHQPGAEDIEAQWLRLLERDGIKAPINVPSVDHRPSVSATLPSVEGDRVCSLFSWVPGRPVAERLSVEIMAECGGLLARLHDHAASVKHEIENASIVAARSAVYMPTDNRILHYQSQFGTLLVEAYARSQGVIDSLWQVPPHAPHLLHGDFGPRNVMTWIKQHYPIDFQDVQFGFDVQDIAITVADLRRTNPDFIKPFIRGYSEMRPWPDMSPDLERSLAIARSLNVMNLGLHLERPGLGEYIEAHCRRIRRYMEPKR